MGLPVSVKVNFRGNVKRFVAQDRDKLDWESVEAWIKASFGINHFQVKYFDEDNEEICINSQDEYEEAIKSADKQGNQLHMNVYKMKGQACGGALKTEVKELKGDLRPAPPYPSRVKTVDKGTQVTPEREAAMVKDIKGTKSEDEPPPMWFRSYMEKFKDEVVKEVVERMCSDFSGQCCTHRSSEEPPEASGGAEAGRAAGAPIGPRPGPSSSNGSLGYTPNCSSCTKPTSEGAYKCSVCPSCILCELCRHKHDPSHSLVRTKTPLSIPEHGMSAETRFPRRGDRTVRKAERQRLKAERRQLRAEVKEIKKKLRLEKRGLHWSGASTSGRSDLGNTASAATQAPPPPSGPAPVPEPQASSPEAPGSSVTTMAALFLDENLPDGTRLQPGTKFIKYWKMKNSGSVSWTSETKLVFMWGNLGLASEERRSVPVPLLQPGQVGVVSVAFVAPLTEGTFTSHWRLTHCGTQFGPRVWCSIVVDTADTQSTYTHQSKRRKEELKSSDSLNNVGFSFDQDFFPSVDLLTAQDLLSFELLEINIVQELEKVPNNTPVALTPCISPLPHDALGSERPVDTHTKDEVTGVRKLFGMKPSSSSSSSSSCSEAVAQEEEREEEISGAQFLCETLIRSLTLEEAPDHRPPRRLKAAAPPPPLCTDREVVAPSTNTEAHQEAQEQEKQSDLQTLSEVDSSRTNPEQRVGAEDWDEVSSQTSSVSSCEDFIIVLPDCFDTSRPLGDSMYSSALSQTNTTAIQPQTCSDPEEREEKEEEEQEQQEAEEEAQPDRSSSSVNQLLFASQTLDAVTLTPEVVTLPPPPTLYSPRSEALYLAESPSPPHIHRNVSSGLSRSAGSASSAFETYNPRPSHALQPRGPGGITEGLVKGALSVAASAYKALFTGPNCSIQRGIDPAAKQDPSMMAVLMEMGFRDRRLNQRLLRKHGYSLLRTVNELVQRADDAEPAP